MSDIKISKYNNIKSKISSSSFYFDSAIDKLKKSSESLSEGVILNYKAYDDGKLKEYAIELDKILSDLKSISSFCSNKISAINASKSNSSKTNNSTVNNKTTNNKTITNNTNVINNNKRNNNGLTITQK